MHTYVYNKYIYKYAHMYICVLSSVPQNRIPTVKAPILLGPRVGPYSIFKGSGSLMGPFKPKRAPFLPDYITAATPSLCGGV